MVNGVLVRTMLGRRGRSGIQIVSSTAVGDSSPDHQSGVAGGTGYGGTAGDWARLPLNSAGTRAPSCIATAPIGTSNPRASFGPISSDLGTGDVHVDPVDGRVGRCEIAAAAVTGLEHVAGVSDRHPHPALGGLDSPGALADHRVGAEDGDRVPEQGDHDQVRR